MPLALLCYSASLIELYNKALSRVWWRFTKSGLQLEKGLHESPLTDSWSPFSKILQKSYKLNEDNDWPTLNSSGCHMSWGITLLHRPVWIRWSRTAQWLVSKCERTTLGSRRSRRWRHLMEPLKHRVWWTVQVRLRETLPILLTMWLIFMLLRKMSTHLGEVKESNIGKFCKYSRLQKIIAFW